MKMCAATGFQRWRQQLITKDDPLHVHKTLGILCLLSYVWRFAQFGEEEDMAFGSHPEYTVPTLLLHLMLNLSSFEFNLPPKRIASGYRIWPEYRIHSLAFLCRSLASMAVTWYEAEYNLPTDYRWNLAIVLLSMAAADYGSYLSGKNKSGSIRELDVSPATKFFFSLQQFGATANSLYGMRRYSLHFIFCMIIQCNAFLMTLRRKNLAGHTLLVSLYGLMLIAGFIFGNIEVTRHSLNHFLVMGTIAHTVCAIRLSPYRFIPHWAKNKYLLWTLAFVSMNWLRTEYIGVDAAGTGGISPPLLVSFFATMAAMAVVGYSKCNQTEYTSKKA